MKTKELKNLAKKIAQYETIIRTSNNPKEIHQAEINIDFLMGKISSFEDGILLDEYIQDYMKF